MFTTVLPNHYNAFSSTGGEWDDVNRLSPGVEGYPRFQVIYRKDYLCGPGHALPLHQIARTYVGRRLNQSRGLRIYDDIQIRSIRLPRTLCCC